MKQNKRKRNRLWTAIAATWQRWKRRHRTAAQAMLADEELWLQALMTASLIALYMKKH